MESDGVFAAWLGAMRTWLAELEALANGVETSDDLEEVTRDCFDLTRAVKLGL